MTGIDLAITTPGVYEMPHDSYLRDPFASGSLSSSGARKLLPPNCPARFRYEQDNPPPSTPEFDIGHAAHMLVLGAGPDIVVVDAGNWATKAAKEQRAEAYATGRTPLLAADHDRVQAMARAVREHPIAGALFNPAAGKPEQSLFWEDADSGVTCRARLDWLPDPTDRRMVVADLKTCLSAEPGHIQKAVHNYGYHAQASWYLDGVKALGLADDPAFVFVFVEKTPPYLITVAQLDPDAERIGRELNRRAIDTYRRCKAADHWPGYATDIELISLPAWATRRHEEGLT